MRLGANVYIYVACFVFHYVHTLVALIKDLLTYLLTSNTDICCGPVDMHLNALSCLCCGQCGILSIQRLSIGPCITNVFCYTRWVLFDPLGSTQHSYSTGINGKTGIVSVGYCCTD